MELPGFLFCEETASLMSTETEATRGDPDVSVLLIDDDVELCELMREFFTARGIAVESAHDGRRGLTARSPASTT